MLWNQTVHTDREVTGIWSAVIMKNKKEKTCTSIDVHCFPLPSARQKCRAKGSGKEVKIQIQRMWNLKCTIIPVIIGATGIVTRSLRKNLEIIPGKHSIHTTKDSCTWNITHNTESTAV